MLVGYPIAYAMARAQPKLQPVLVALMIVPFWTSFLIRIYAWIGILKPEGLLNQALIGAGVISEPLEILNTEGAIFIGVVYAYLPFMVLPIYAVLVAQDESLLEAAADLGSPPWKSFWLVTIPLSAPGVAAGCLLCFIPIVGEFIIPDMLGGSDTLMIGRQLWSEFFSNRDWPLASAIAVLMVVILLIPFLVLRRLEIARRRGAAMKRGMGWSGALALTLGFAFIYAPIVLLVLYSFNDSRLVTVWGGFTTRWYSGLLSNEPLMSAAWNSLRVGVAGRDHRNGAGNAHRAGARAVRPLPRPRSARGRWRSRRSSCRRSSPRCRFVALRRH